MKTIYKIVMPLLVLGTFGCEKSLNVKIPVGTYSNAVIYNNPDLAQSAMRGIYETMTGSVLLATPYQGQITGNFAMTADELIRSAYTVEQQQFLDNKLLPGNGAVNTMWTKFYSFIFQTNSLIEGVTASESLSPQLKDALIAEAKLLRAFNYFYLVNLFGNVPLSLSSDFMSNNTIKQSTQEEVYAQIVADLKEAQTKMGNQYTAAGARYRASKSAATALLARVYLYQKKWADAEQQATALINQTALYKLETIDRVFLFNSTETIWGLDNQDSYLHTMEAGAVSGSQSTNTIFRLTPYVISQFEAGDQRGVKWVREGTGTGLGTKSPLKYKLFTNLTGATRELVNPFRLAEQYLIRAEARAEQNKLSLAIDDLDMLRSRAGAVANNTITFQTIRFANPEISKEELIKAVYKERLLEYFAEGGHRWLDAKRSGLSLEDFFGSRKPEIEETDAYLPIPEVEIRRNRNLKQNDGYN